MSKFCIVNGFNIPSSFIQDFSVVGFGIETISEDACWGPGKRPLHLLHFVLSGSGSFNNREIKSGQGFYTTPETIHEYHSSCDNPWSYLWIDFGGNMPAEFCKAIKTDDAGVFTFENGSKIADICEKIKCRAESGHGFDYAEGIELFFSALSTCEFVKDPSHDKDSRTISIAKRFIKQNYHRNIRIRDVADFVCIAPNHLTNLFLRSGEKSPKKYLSHLRIEKACALLADKSLSITEVAVSVGYSDPLQFSRFFSRYTGISPSEYRLK